MQHSWRKEDCIQGFDGKARGEGLKRLRCGCKDNIKMHLRET
jgi:hypothetical protein